MKLISATGTRLVSCPLIMASSNIDSVSGVALYKEVFWDIFYSEELKIESRRSKQLASTIDTLCTKKSTSFCALFQEVYAEVENKEMRVINARYFRFHTCIRLRCCLLCYSI